MNAFLQQSAPSLTTPANPFAMEEMRRQLDSFSGNAPAAGRTGSPALDAGLEQARMEAAFRPASGAARVHSHSPLGFSATEFQRFQQHGSSGAQTPVGARPQNGSALNGLSRPMGLGYGMGMGYGTGMGVGMRSPSYMPAAMQAHPQPQQQSEGKGKGRMVELDDKDWEQQFAALDARGDDTEALDEAARAAMESELDGIDRSVASETGDGDFESIWRSIQAERLHNRQMDRDDTAFNTTFDPSEILPKGMTDDELKDWTGFDSWDTAVFNDPQLGNYMFEQDNPFRAVGDPFSEGVRILDEAGNLSLAALAFEAAVQKDPSHVEAWTLLGSAQAQNEKEAPAIRALEQALKVDADNTDALMGLAVSYTNEGYDATAYRTLERWLSVRYPQVAPPDQLSSAADVGFTDRRQLHDRITDLFVRAAALRPAGVDMDPDVQVGLGVLLYGADQYDKAVDCFGAALASAEPGSATSRRQRHLLWNRLGATLANSGRSEEAISAYEQALTLNPNFVRARYNLGVSCINVGCFPEAAQHLLGALSMHKVVEREGRERVREVVGGGAAGSGALDDQELDRLVAMNQSTNLFETLRRVFSQMDRRDLADMVVPGMDVDVFRKEFDF